jgi:predicted N-formylglutamate amidohydrolase
MHKYFFSCEHAGNQIPASLKNEVKIPKSVINTHRAIDLGAKNILLKLAKEFNSEPLYNDISRLIIEYNRSMHHPKLFSEYSRGIDQLPKDLLIRDYKIYRQKIIKKVKNCHYHLSIHSFTPVLNEVTRNCEIGLLYDPRRFKEKRFCEELKKLLNEQGITCRLNYPYKGISDGLTTYLRKEIGSNYAGIEIEFNQKIIKSYQILNSVIHSLKLLTDRNYLF